MGLWQSVKGFFNPIPHAVDVVPSPAPGVSTPPRRWTSAVFGPGNPIRPTVDQYEEPEPRSFDYVPSVNATISPRIAYGLMSFGQLKTYAESIPEIGRCRRLITNELKAFYPQIKDSAGNIIPPEQLPQLKWMTTSPDGKMEWSVWLSRFLFNVLIYDAGTLYKLFNDDGQVIGLRVIDGSTMFPVINEYAEQPLPPSPAYVQVIKGMPYKWFTSDTLWYQPFQVRPDAPYGLTPIEDALSSVQVLQSYWEWINSFYTEGNMPGDRLVAPPEWSWEQVLQWEEARNAKMVGNIPAMRQEQWYPYGATSLSRPPDTGNSREADYKTAFEALSFAFGIPPSEWGDAPGAGLGGKGYQDKMESALFRMCIGPYKAHIEMPFNEILQDYGYKDCTFELSFPAQTIDPEQEEEKTLKRWQGGLVTRNEARENLEMEARPDGDVYYQQGPAAPATGGTVSVNGYHTIPVTNGGGEKIPVTNSNGTVSVTQNGGKVTVSGSGEKVVVKRLLKEQADLLKHCGVCPEDDALFGAVVSRKIPLAFPKQSTNGIEIVAIDDPTAGVRPAIWRPVTGEDIAQQEVVGGPLYVRDEAVYLLDRIMDFYLVPVAFATEVDGIPGAVCHYVKHSDGKPLDDYSLEWIEKAGILDYISGQLDRHSGNWLTHPDEPGRMVLIDNGMSFSGVSGYQSPFADYIRQHGLSQAGQDAVYTALNDEALWVDIAELVGETAANLARQRAAALISRGGGRDTGGVVYPDLE